MALKSKIELICEIVDWEHRYTLGKLQPTEWCFQRIKFLDELNKENVLAIWRDTFELGKRRPQSARKQN